MKIGKTLYLKNRQEWRRWLKKNHKKENEIWLIYYKKHTKKPSIPYNDAVEEALCFGWIDSIEKRINEERYAQRFTPRKPKSNWSEMNKERVRRLIKDGKMTPAGLATFGNNTEIAFKIPQDILEALNKERKIWNNFSKFPESYKRIRVGWIDGARKRPKELEKRLKYFLQMTSENKTFGMVK